jgi:hypothetical protein
MSNSLTRFKDRERYLWAMADCILVVCPRCGGRAEVRRSGLRFACLHCGHSIQVGIASWGGMATAIAARSCGWCGHPLCRRVRRAGPHLSEIRVHCPACRHWNFVPVVWKQAPEKEPVDPYFGFRLWLQTRCAGEVLWAYNAKHLVFLHDYVIASLRERRPNANASLVSRLPKWLKRAQNRDAVLRAARRLATRLAS